MTKVVHLNYLYCYSSQISSDINLGSLVSVLKIFLDKISDGAKVLY